MLALLVALIALVMVMSALIEDLALREKRRRRLRDQHHVAAE